MIRPVLLTLAAASLGVAGCSKPTDPAPQGAKDAPPAVRSKPADNRLQKALAGAWRLDQDALQNDPEIAKLPDEAKAKALTVLRELMKGTRMQFGADGTLQMTFGKRTQTGTYKIVGAKAGVLTLESTTGAGPAQKVETITAKVDGDRLQITGPDGKSLDLVREGSAADTRAPEPTAAPARTTTSAAAPAAAPSTATPAPGTTTAPTSAAAPAPTAAD